MSSRLRTTVLTVAAAAAMAVSLAPPAAAFYEGLVPYLQTPPQATSVAADPDGTGYWTMVDSQGISAHGGARFLGTYVKPANQSFGTIVTTPDGTGYWGVDNTVGVVTQFGTAAKLPNFDTTGFKNCECYLTDVVATLSGQGLIGVDWAGHVWTVGDGVSYGDVSREDGRHPGATSIELTPTGKGYLIAGAGGAVWSRGDAVARGGLAPNQYKIITSMAMTTSGNGYWLVNAQGGVTPFGDATAQPGTLTNSTSAVTYIASRPNGAGYYLAHENGAVDTFGTGVTKPRPSHPRPRP